MNPFKISMNKDDEDVKEFTKTINTINRLDDTVNLSTKTKVNTTILTYDVHGDEDVEVKLLKERFNDVGTYTMQDLSRAYGDSKGYNLHASLMGTKNLKNDTRDLLAKFLDLHFVTFLSTISDAEKLSSGEKVLVVKNKEDVLPEDVTIDIQL